MLPPIMDADISEAARSADLGGVNVDNEKSQEDLANMLRLLIAKFCDQHFIKQLQKAKLTNHRSSQLSDHNESKMDTSSTTSGTQSNLVVDENASSDDVNSTISNKNNDLNNKDKLTNEPIENETNTTKLNDDVKLNNNNNSSSNEEEAKEQPNESSESKTVAYDELIDNTSDKTNNQNTDLVLNKTDNLVSPPSSDIAMNMEANPTTPTGDSSSSSSSTSSENKKSDSGISTNNSDQDATMEDCATTKSIREISSSSEREHHRLHHMNLRSKDQSDEDYLVPSSKLWSTILIGADKLEIFGSIHVRSNNVRLLSCLIDEQLSIDSSEVNLSFSSAASISSGSCSSKVLIKPSNKSNPKYAKLDSSRIIDLVGRQASSARKSSFNDRHHQTRRHHHHYRRSSRNRRYRSHREQHRGYQRNCCDLDVYKSPRKQVSSSEPKIKQSTNRRKQTSYRNAFSTAQSVQEPVVGAELNEDIYDENNEINKNENDETNIEDFANNQEGIDYCDYEPECGEDEYDEEELELDEFNQQFVNKDKSAHRKQHLRDQFSKIKKGGAQKQQQQSQQKTSDAASKSDGKDQAEESVVDKTASNLVSNGGVNGAVNSDDQAAKNDLAMIYPMKKFKAYHHYCNNKRKLIQEEQEKQQEAQDKSLVGDDQAGKEAQANEMSTNEAQTTTTTTTNGSSLANLANVAAAAMKLNSAENKTGKKSRKPSAPLPQNGLDHHNESELDYDVDELDENVEHKSKADYPYLYDEEEDVHYDDDDNSSVVSSYSTGSGHSFRNNHNNENGNVVVVRSHSRCSTLSSGAVSSRSVSLNGSASSRSPSCTRNKHKVSRHMSHSARRNISPSPSIASSSYLNDYDDENAYRSYSSSSSYKSDYENYDYDNEEMNNNEDEFNSRRRVRGHHARKHGDKSSRNNSNRAYYRSNGELDKRDKSNGSTIMNELVNEDEQMEFGNPEENSGHKVKPSQNGAKHLSHRPSGHHHHHHRRKPHHVRHDIDQAGIANDGVQSKQNDKDADVQQPMSKSPLNSSQTQAQQQSQQQVEREDRKRDEEYLMRKYKRRFMPYNSNTNGATNGSGEGLSGLDTNSNLYLLASSRQHHRAYTSNGSDTKDNIPSGNEHHHYMHNEHLGSKLMPVNTLVDRLSPISDPDLEERNKNQNGSSYENGSAKLNGGMHLKGLNSDANHGKLHHQTGNDANSDINILNRINNLSPSSSSSSSSSVKQQQQANGQLGLNGNSQLSSVFHHSSLQQQQQHNPAAAVLAAAAAAAAAADLRNIAAVGASPHHHHHHQLAAAHQASSQSLHNHHHAQSVAALLADMQQQQQQQQSQQQQDVAKVLAATLSNGQHHHHLNQHHGHAAQALLSRFSNGASQNDLMAAVLAQQQQQQQQHRSLLDSHHHHLHNNGHHHNGNYAAALNATNGQIYSRYSTHLANVAAAAAAAASSAAVHSSSHRRLI